MFGNFFDRAKDVAIAAIVAGFLAIAGVSALTVAAAWQLSLWMPWPAALTVTGVGLLAIAAISLWVGMQTNKKKDEPAQQDFAGDVDPVAMVLGLMELPVEVVKKIVSEKPIASIAVLSSIGLLIARKPEVALRLFDKVVGGLGSGLGGKE